MTKNSFQLNYENQQVIVFHQKLANNSFIIHNHNFGISYKNIAKIQAKKD